MIQVIQTESFFREHPDLEVRSRGLDLVRIANALRDQLVMTIVMPDSKPVPEPVRKVEHDTTVPNIQKRDINNWKGTRERRKLATEAALLQSNGDIQKASRILGVTYRAVKNRIKIMSIQMTHMRQIPK